MDSSLVLRLSGLKVPIQVVQMQRQIKMLSLVFLLFLFGAVWTPGQTLDGVTSIRFAHFSPDAPFFDVYVDGERFGDLSLDFGEASEWSEFVPGTYRIALVPGEGGVADALIGPSEFEIEPGQWYTIALIGFVATDSLQAQVLLEDYSEIAAGETRLSFLHAIENAPPVDVYANQNALLEFVSYPGQVFDSQGVANDGFVQVDVISGLYEMQILEHGTDGSVFIDLGAVDLFANQNALLAMVGTIENPQFVRFNTSINVDGGQDGGISELGDGVGYLRFAHFSSGTPDVDIYIDNALSEVQQLSFSDVTDYVAVPAGVYVIDVAPVNTSLNDRVIGPLEVAVATGNAVTVAAIGTLANNTLAIQAFTERYNLDSAIRVGVSVFHAIPGFGPVDVIVDDQIRVGLLGFPGSQGSNDGLATFDLLRGVYDIEIVLSESPDEVLLSLENYRLSADRHYLITLVVAEPSYLITTTLLEQLTVNGIDRE